jgi:U4/U6.U5 tri-snRNP-associated protein 1
MADAMSIEETNRIRVSLGMKPLPVPGQSNGPVFKEASAPTNPEDEPGSTLESREAEAYGNFQKVQQAEEARRRRDAKAEAIKKARDLAKRNAKLEGKGLGDADDEEDTSARAWLMKQKKRQKDIEKARKREQELAEQERLLQAEYTAKDLAGVKVGHELGTFQEGEEQVLVLKDTTIDENEEEGDELENLDLREREKLKEKLELKKKKPVYNPNDAYEDGEHKILSHYDEEIEGKKKTRFTLDGQGHTVEELQALAQEDAQKAKPKAISLDFDVGEKQPQSDYLDISEIKVKKPKKKKKSTRQKPVDEDDIVPLPEESPQDEDAMEVDSGAAPVKKRTFDDASFVDDDDLQASLSAQRRAALKKRKRVRPEDIAKQLREQSEAAEEADNGPVGLVIDETSEFVANLRHDGEERRPRRSVSRARSISRQPSEPATGMEDDEGDTNMQESYANIEDEEDRTARIKREEEEKNMSSVGMEEELTLDQGLGSTLKLLKDRGIIKESGAGDLNEHFREKQRFLAEKQRREAAAEFKARQQRERDRQTGRLDRMSAREKEDYARQQNAYRDQQESRLLAEHFNKEYKPNVELKYVDEHGRSMGQKEAFKHLSHQFHGKGSGKQKTEKMLKKIEEEKRRESQSILDSSQLAGMAGAQQQQVKKQRQAGVRLA